MRTLDAYDADDYRSVEGVEGLWDFSQPFSWEIEYIEKSTKNPPNPPTFHTTPDQQRLTNLLLVEFKTMQQTKKAGRMPREDVIFDLAWRLHVKEYPTSSVSELEDQVAKFLDEDKELKVLFDMIALKRVTQNPR